jgi:hypothetical protein
VVLGDATERAFWLLSSESFTRATLEGACDISHIFICYRLEICFLDCTLCTLLLQYLLTAIVRWLCGAFKIVQTFLIKIQSTALLNHIVVWGCEQVPPSLFHRSLPLFLLFLLLPSNRKIIDSRNFRQSRDRLICLDRSRFICSKDYVLFISWKGVGFFPSDSLFLQFASPYVGVCHFVCALRGAFFRIPHLLSYQQHD